MPLHWCPAAQCNAHVFCRHGCRGGHCCFYGRGWAALPLGPAQGAPGAQLPAAAAGAARSPARSTASRKSSCSSAAGAADGPGRAAEALAPSQPALAASGPGKECSAGGGTADPGPDAQAPAKRQHRGKRRKQLVPLELGTAVVGGEAHAGARAGVASAAGGAVAGPAAGNQPPDPIPPATLSGGSGKAVHVGAAPLSMAAAGVAAGGTGGTGAPASPGGAAGAVQVAPEAGEGGAVAALANRPAQALPTHTKLLYGGLALGGAPLSTQIPQGEKKSSSLRATTVENQCHVVIDAPSITRACIGAAVRARARMSKPWDSRRRAGVPAGHGAAVHGVGGAPSGRRRGRPDRHRPHGAPAAGSCMSCDCGACMQLGAVYVAGYLLARVLLLCSLMSCGGMHEEFHLPCLIPSSASFGHTQPIGFVGFECDLLDMHWQQASGVKKQRGPKRVGHRGGKRERRRARGLAPFMGDPQGLYPENYAPGDAAGSGPEPRSGAGAEAATESDGMPGGEPGACPVR